jgi:hypothetical protein
MDPFRRRYGVKENYWTTSICSGLLTIISQLPL